MEKFTQLDDRKLWHDGDSTINANNIAGFLKDAHNIFVDTITDDIKQFNQFVDPEKQIKIKKDVADNNFEWNIPEEYKALVIKDHISDKLVDEIERQGWDEENPLVFERVMRVITEIGMFEKLKLNEVLRVIIYIINTLEAKNVVWGVGRGSSVSSYVLYLIGVHDVDSVAYDLNITDFLKT